MPTQIDLAVASKVLEVVDAGLVRGVGIAEPGKMCVEAAVVYALGLPHGDDPSCVSRSLRALKIKLNDLNWSSDQARAQGLRRLALAQLGSAGSLDDKEFTRRVAELAIKTCVPQALRAAASIQKNEHHKQAMLDAANRCEKEGTREAVLEGKSAAAAYAAADAAAYNAADAAYAAADAAYAAADAAYAAAAAAAADAYAYADAAAYAYAAAYAADAYAAADADAAAARDKSLADFAEGVVQILIDMKAPGCQWLYLTEVT